MILREMRPDDLPQIEALHARMGLDYRMPDLSSPLFVVREVAEHDGKIVAAVVGRVTVEAYLWVGEKPAIKSLAKVFYQKCWQAGFDDIIAAVPEKIEGIFSRALKKMGWEPIREGWRVYNKEL